MSADSGRLVWSRSAWEEDPVELRLGVTYWFDPTREVHPVNWELFARDRDSTRVVGFEYANGVSPSFPKNRFQFLAVPCWFIALLCFFQPAILALSRRRS